MEFGKRVIGADIGELYSCMRSCRLPPLNALRAFEAAARHRLGVRSGGEGGTTPALAAVINTIVDALSELGVRHIEMPASPEQVWRAIQGTRAASAG